jgi:hypothetical protein
MIPGIASNNSSGAIKGKNKNGINIQIMNSILSMTYLTPVDEEGKKLDVKTYV